MVLVIIASNIIMLWTLHFKGLHYGYELGQRSVSGGWNEQKYFFQVLENIFNIMFLFELVFRMWLHGWAATRGPAPAQNQAASAQHPPPSDPCSCILPQIRVAYWVGPCHCLADNVINHPANSIN